MHVFCGLKNDTHHVLSCSDNVANEGISCAQNSRARHYVKCDSVANCSGLQLLIASFPDAAIMVLTVSMVNTLKITCLVDGHHKEYHI